MSKKLEVLFIEDGKDSYCIRWEHVRYMKRAKTYNEKTSKWKIAHDRTVFLLECGTNITVEIPIEQINGAIKGSLLSGDSYAEIKPQRRITDHEHHGQLVVGNTVPIGVHSNKINGIEHTKLNRRPRKVA